MGNKIKLKELQKKGYTKIGTYEHYLILQKGDEKILYNPKKKEIVELNTYYGIRTYYESKPEICFKTSLFGFGKAEIVVAGKNSRLEEISEEEVNEALEKLERLGRNSKKRESDRE